MKMDAEMLHQHLNKTSLKSKLCVENLPARVYGRNITILLGGARPLAAHSGLLFKLRGALGHRLLEGGCEQAGMAFQNEPEISSQMPVHKSAESTTDQPEPHTDFTNPIKPVFETGASPFGCNCRPACALHVLYGRHSQINDNGHRMFMASPFVLFARPQGRNLVINLSLAGFAGQWQDELRLALIQALKGNDLPWAVMARDCQVRLIPARPEILGSKISEISLETRLAQLTKEIEHADNAENRAGLRLVFLTGIEINNRKTPLSADDLLARLIDRAITLAPWFGADLVMDRENIYESWHRLGKKLDIDKTPQIKPRKSARSGLAWDSVSVKGELALTGNGEDLLKLLPLLVFCEQFHLARSATTGLGRYKLVEL